MNTLEHIREVMATASRITTPNDSLELGVSYYFDKPRRAVDTKFPPGYGAMGNIITHGRFFVMHTDKDNPNMDAVGYLSLSNGEQAAAIPHTNVITGGIYMPRAAQFDNDATAWHAIFHEGAHMLHSRFPHLMNYGRITRHVNETIADLAAYGAMRVVGLEPSKHTPEYVHSWLSQTNFLRIMPRLPDEIIEFSAAIANELVRAYNKALEETTNV